MDHRKEPTTGVLVTTTASSPSGQLAIDEALVRAPADRLALRLWVNPPCVVVGRFQDRTREVDLAGCARDGVPVVRRASGGGTVFHDQGTLNVSLVAPGRLPGLLGTLVELVVRALGEFELSATVHPRGIYLGTGKLCGLASLQTAAATLAHASLLVTTPPTRVAAYLTPTPAIPDRRDSRRAPVTRLAAHAPADLPAAADAVRRCAHRIFGGLPERKLSCSQRDTLARLRTERYDNPEWHRTGRDRSGRNPTGQQKEAPYQV